MKRVIAFLLVTVFLASFVSSEDEKGYYVITHSENDLAKVQETIKDTFGEEIESYIYPNQYLVYTTEKDLEHIDAIVSYEPYDLANHLSDLDIGEKNEYLVHLFDHANAENIAYNLEEKGIVVEQVDNNVIQVSLDEDSFDSFDMTGVKIVEERPEEVQFSQMTKVVTGMTTTWQRFGIYGGTQTVTVLDGGLDTGIDDATMHDDLEGRIVSMIDMHAGANSDNCVDYDSHGTHAAGVVLGNGLLSGSNPLTKSYGGSYAGAVPEAQLIFHCVGGDQGSTFKVPPSLLASFIPSYLSGSRVHSNSWGTNTLVGTYNPRSQSIDDYTWNNKDFTVVFATGNFLGAGTVLPPSTAKNAIAVSGHWRDDMNQRTGPEGPTTDGRFKPDILAPSIATNNPSAEGIVSTKSSQQLSFPVGCQGGPGNGMEPFYCEQSGTSVAAPWIAGGVALIREYYQTERSVSNPSAALLKATLLNGGQQVNGKPIPSFENGWGRMDLSASLPKNKKQLKFVDEQTGLTIGNKNTYTYYASAQKPFILTLVWTDAKGSCITPTAPCQSQKQLVNDLDLKVIDPQGTIYHGNDIVAPFDDTKDRLNNVEQVRINTPIPGKYTVEVEAFTVPVGAQDYAFVLTHQPGRGDSRPEQVKDSDLRICMKPNGQPC